MLARLPSLITGLRTCHAFGHGSRPVIAKHVSDFCSKSLQKCSSMESIRCWLVEFHNIGDLGLPLPIFQFGVEDVDQ